MDLSKLEYGSVVMIGDDPYLFYGNRDYSGVNYLLAVNADGVLRTIFKEDIKAFFTKEKMGDIVKAAELESRKSYLMGVDTNLERDIS